LQGELYLLSLLKMIILYECVWCKK
jgi:hypothetical protein